jgi:molybdate transport system substrate-binding protein
MLKSAGMPMTHTYVATKRSDEPAMGRGCRSRPLANPGPAAHKKSPARLIENDERGRMKRPIPILLVLLAAIVLLGEGSAAQQADLHVVATFGIQGAMEEILPEYKRATGQNVSIEYEESAVIRQQILSGKIFDLAILVPQVIGDLIKSGQIKTGTQTDIAKTSLGIGIRSGALGRDIRTAEGVKETLLSVRSITFSKVGSATPKIEKMIESLGIASVINPRIVRTDLGRPADAVGAGKIDLVIAPASAIVSVRGVDFVGLLPAEFQDSVVLTAGIGTRSERPNRAKGLVEFIRSSKGSAILRVSGMEPAGTSR